MFDNSKRRSCALRDACDGKKVNFVFVFFLYHVGFRLQGWAYCTYVYVCICMCMCVYVYVYMKVHVDVYGRVHMYAYVCLCMCMSMYIECALVLRLQLRLRWGLILHTRVCAPINVYKFIEN